MLKMKKKKAGEMQFIMVQLQMLKENNLLRALDLMRKHRRTTAARYLQPVVSWHL